MANLFMLGRLTFFLALTAIWSGLFLIPGFTRYLKREIGVVESSEEAESLAAAAVTLCPFESKFQGWRNSPRGENVTVDFLLNNYRKRCEGANTTQDFITCVQTKTFSLNETIPEGYSRGMGPSQNLSSIAPSDWLADVTTALSGRCYTLNYTQRLTTDLQTDSLVFNLDPDKSYMIFIHQLDFFIVNYNPLSMPRIYKTLKFKDVGNYYRYQTN